MISVLNSISIVVMILACTYAILAGVLIFYKKTKFLGWLQISKTGYCFVYGISAFCIYRDLFLGVLPPDFNGYNFSAVFLLFYLVLMVLGLCIPYLLIVGFTKIQEFRKHIPDED